MANKQTQGTFVNAGVFYEEGDPYFLHNDFNLRSAIHLYGKNGTNLIVNIDNFNNIFSIGSSKVPPASFDPQTLSYVSGSVNGYISSEVENLGTGGTASSDFVALIGTVPAGIAGTYVDLGIAGPSFNDANQALFDASAGYVFSNSSNFYVGAGTTGTLSFFSNGYDSKSKLRATIDPSGNIALGTGAIGSASANGFTYLPGGAGAPTGTPTAKTGMVPMYYDTTNNNFYFYTGATWKKQAGTYA